MTRRLFYILSSSITAAFLLAGAIIRIPLKQGAEQEVSTVVRGISEEEMLTGNDAGYSGSPTELLPGTMININTAEADELQQLPGIGPALSEAIVEYREENGPFSSIEDIMLVKGIAEGKFSAICNNITVGDDR